MKDTNYAKQIKFIMKIQKETLQTKTRQTN